MATALERLRYELNHLHNQDVPLESIKDLFNEYIDEIEDETMSDVVQPIQSIYSGPNRSLDNGEGGQLVWDTLDDGPALLDLTTGFAPGQAPTILTPGLYAISVTISASQQLTPGGWVNLAITVSSQSSEAWAQGFFPVDAGVTANLVSVLSEGTQISAVCTNYDGVSARTFHIDTATIVKIT